MDVAAGQIAVITGAGHGIGRELARQLTAAGCHVAACDVSEAGLQGTRDACEGNDGRLSTHVVDVSSEADQLRFAEEVRREHDTDHIHFLFNNAGVGGGGSLFTNLREEWERTFAIDWGGVYLGVRTFLPMLVAADQARIINTSSVNGFWASVGRDVPHTAYSAAKFAVKGFTEALMNDLRINAPHVTAAVVMPGHIGTQIVANTRKAMTGNHSDALSKRELAGARAGLAAAGVEVDRLSDDDVQAILADQVREFVEQAPTTAEQAATIILDGIRRDQWRILVGDDAHTVDRLVREDPENAYTSGFYRRIRDEAGWALNR